MSLSFISTTTVTACRLVDSVFDEANNVVRIVDISANTLRNFDADTGLQIGSNINLSTNPYAICMISSASALIGYQSQTQGFDLVEVSSNFKQTYSNPSAGIPLQAKGQQIASDQSLKIAFSCSTSAQILIKFDGNNFTRTALTLATRQCTINCIILKESGRWLLGTDNTNQSGGMIFEIDSDGNIVDSMEIPRKMWFGNYSTFSSISGHKIRYMSYGDNILVVGTELGEVFHIDWSTKTVLDYILLSSQTFGNTLSNMSDGLVLAAPCFPTSGFSSAIFELDPTIGRMHYSSDPMFLNDISFQTVNIHVQQSTGKVVITRVNAGTTATKLTFATLTPRASQTTTFTVQDPPGTDIACRLWIIQDEGVGGDSKILLDTYMQSPATYRIPSGATLRALVKYGEGNDAKYQMSVFNT